MAEGWLERVFAPEATDASIRACAQKAIELGGGIVMLPPGEIQILSPLPTGSGLMYVGQTVPSWLELTSSVSTGTVLLGDGVPDVSPGTYNCFEHNPVDASSVGYANPDAMHADGIRGMAISNVVLRSFKHGVKMGAKYKTGCHSLRMDHVIAEHCDWGFWTENCMQPMFGHLYYGQCKSGGFAHGDSMNALWHFGNGIIEHVYGQNSGGMSTAKTVGVDIFARGDTSELNNITIFNLQANGFNGASYSQAGTVITSGNANIPITSNISKFMVDGVVTPGSAIGNIDSNNLYWITSISDNGDGTGSIQIGTSRRAASAVVPSAGGTTTLKLLGLPLIQIGGHGNNNNSITNSRFPLIDCEAASGVGVAVQRILGCYIETSIISGNGADFVGLTFTNSDVRNSFRLTNTVALAWINVNSAQFAGVKPTAYHGGSNAFKSRHQGLLADYATGASKIFMTSDRRATGNMSPDTGDIYVGSPSSFPSIGLGRPLQHFHGRLASGATISSNSGGFVTYTGAGGGNLTLPAIASGMEGMQIEISNPSSGTLTVNTSSSQLINNIAATTSFVMSANTVSKFTAATTDGTTFFWAVR